MYIDESKLPTELTVADRVRVAYATEITDIVNAIDRGQSVLISTDPRSATHILEAVMERLGLDDQLVVADSTATTPEQQLLGDAARILQKIEAALNSGNDDVVVAIPTFGVLVSDGQGGVTAESKRFATLAAADPECGQFLAVINHVLTVPPFLAEFFDRRVTCTGIRRETMPQVITAAESRKFSPGPGRFDPGALYKYVGGMSPQRLSTVMRVVVETVTDFPGDCTDAIQCLRSASLSAGASLPDLDFDDIGGYPDVKDKLRENILDLQQLAQETDNPKTRARINEMTPRGVIFHGPPGTGKTLFAKAMAKHLGAAAFVIAGPEIKSRWVGSSEENVRRIFADARANAPAVIVIDELDSIARARGSDIGSGVGDSIVNQLLTEMDGLGGDDAMVFVVGTTNFLDSLDPAVVRPGRFDLQIEIGVPDADARRHILGIYNERFELQIHADIMDGLVSRTAGPKSATTFWTGAELAALCQSVARRRLMKRVEGDTTQELIDDVFRSETNQPRLSADERRVVAVHEAGHAVVALSDDVEHAPEITRITTTSDISGALGYVQFTDGDKYVETKETLQDRICVLLGGRAAEQVVNGTTCTGAANDIGRATGIARAMVEQLGMGPTLAATGRDRTQLSERTRERLDNDVEAIVQEQMARAQTIIKKNRTVLDGIVAVLVERGSIEMSEIGQFKVVGAETGPS